MKIDKHENYIVLTDERNDVANFAAFLERKVPASFEEDNLVINLMEFTSFSLDQLLLFLKLSNYHRASKHSFVIANDAINPDDVPFEMVVVPTLQEAGDIIAMEDIERDLGF